jgi:hypothetical protein
MLLTGSVGAAKYCGLTQMDGRLAVCVTCDSTPERFAKCQPSDSSRVVTVAFPTLASTIEMQFLVGDRIKWEVLRRVLAGAGLSATRAYSRGDLVAHREAVLEHRDAA